MSKKKRRPRMTEEEYQAFISWRESRETNESDPEETLEEFAERRQLNISEITQVWHKGKFHSVKTKPGQVSYEDVRDDIIKEMNKHSPSYKKIIRREYSNGHLLVVDIADLHINKYACSDLTGDEYNTQLAVERAVNGTKGILEKANGFNIDKILFVIGNDVLNTDTIFKSTTKGTQQDTDVHWFKAFQIAREAYVKCIDICLTVADVDVVHCPSNHDLMSGCFLADSLMSWYRKSKNVTFDVSPKYRKYYSYYSNMISLEHGDKGKMANIPLLAAQEEPTMWAETKFRYGYLHHIHHSDKNSFKSGKDYVGYNITYLRSPSNPDLWHTEEGYKNLVAVEGFVHSKYHGRVSQITHYF